MTANPPGAGAGPRRAGRRARTVRVLGPALAAGVLLVACGSAPDYRYVANGDRSIVVKVPDGWAELDNSKLGATSSADAWQAYFDGSGKPDVSHFDTRLPISPPDTPAMRLLSIKTDPGTEIPDDELRDLVTPNTRHGLAKFVRQSWLDDVALSDYAVLSETKVDSAQAHGLRIRSAYAFDVGNLVDVGGAPQTPPPQQVVVVDKIALASKDGKHVHVLQVWCSLSCFRERAAQIDEVMSSYTVKLQP